MVGVHFANEQKNSQDKVIPSSKWTGTLVRHLAGTQQFQVLCAHSPNLDWESGSIALREIQVLLNTESTISFADQIIFHVHHTCVEFVCGYKVYEWRNKCLAACKMISEGSVRSS